MVQLYRHPQDVLAKVLDLFICHKSMDDKNRMFRKPCLSSVPRPACMVQVYYT